MQNDRDLVKQIGNAIAKRRRMAGLTQAEIAERLGISNDAISRMERGSIMPTVLRLIQFAEIFHCEASDLLTESSTLLPDQSKRLAALLAKLDDRERETLLGIIESMVAWHLQKGSC